jgi:hypothetical protein
MDANVFAAEYKSLLDVQFVQLFAVGKNAMLFCVNDRKFLI